MINVINNKRGYENDIRGIPHEFASLKIKIYDIILNKSED